MLRWLCMVLHLSCCAMTGFCLFAGLVGPALAVYRRSVQRVSLCGARGSSQFGLSQQALPWRESKGRARDPRATAHPPTTVVIFLFLWGVLVRDRRAQAVGREARVRALAPRTPTCGCQTWGYAHS